MSKRMRTFIAAARRAARPLPAFSLSALLVCGCAAQPAAVADGPVKLQEPVVQPEPAAPAETTSLQRYQEINKLYEAQKVQDAALQAQLAQQSAALQKTETENADLRKQLQGLNEKASRLDAMQAKLDEAQKTSLALESTLSDVRRQLLEERLDGVKRDQVIVALKIQMAKDTRKTGATSLALPDSAASQTAGPVAGGQDIVPAAGPALPAGNAEKASPVANP